MQVPCHGWSVSHLIEVVARKFNEVTCMSLMQCNFIIITCKVCDKFMPRHADSNGAATSMIPSSHHMLNTLYDENAGTHAVRVEPVVTLRLLNQSIVIMNTFNLK